MTLRRWHRAATKTVAVTLNATLRTPRKSLEQPRGQWQHSMKQFHSEGETDERYTPSWVLERVEKALNGIDLDPCADPRKRVPATRHLTKEDDALASAWAGSVFMNPPFSDTSVWVKHLSIYIATGAVDQAIVLVPQGSVTNKGFSLFMNQASAMVLLTPRLNFLDLNYEPIGEFSSFNVALVYYGVHTTRFLDSFDEVGIGSLLYKSNPQRKQVFCQHCGSAFKAQRSTAKFCSTTCRVSAHRKTVSQN